MKSMKRRDGSDFVQDTVFGDKKKTLLILVPCISYGGLERFAITTAETLRDQYDVTLLYFYSSDKEIPTDVASICIDVPYSDNLWGQIHAMLKRNYLVWKYKHTHQVDISFAVGKVASYTNVMTKRGERCISSIHGYTDIPLNSAGRALARWILSRSDKTVFVAKALRDAYCQAVRFAKEKTTVLYNPFLIDEIQKKSSQKVSLEGNPIICSCGRLVKIKNVEQTIRAIGFLKPQYPDIKLYVVGDGPERDTLEHVTETLELQKNVMFVGNQDNPFPFFAGAEVFVMNSLFEGFGRTVVEALACETAVVASDCRVGVREILSDEEDRPWDLPAQEIEFAEYGVLLPPSLEEDSVERKMELAKMTARAIDMLMRNAPLRREYRKRGLERARVFDLPQYQEAVLRLFEGDCQ